MGARRLWAPSPPDYSTAAHWEARICKLPLESSWLVSVRAPVPFCALGSAWRTGGAGESGVGSVLGRHGAVAGVGLA